MAAKGTNRGESSRRARGDRDLPIPLFHLGETACIGPYAYDRRTVGQRCKINCIAVPIDGEYRYGVSTENGMYTIVLEATLEKVFERGRWSDCAWQPRRAAR